MQEIYSLKDKKIQLAKELATHKGRLRLGRFLIENQTAIEWAVEAGSILSTFKIPKLRVTGYRTVEYRSFPSVRGIAEKGYGDKLRYSDGRRRQPKKVDRQV